MKSEWKEQCSCALKMYRIRFQRIILTSKRVCLYFHQQDSFPRTKYPGKDCIEIVTDAKLFWLIFNTKLTLKLHTVP